MVLALVDWSYEGGCHSVVGSWDRERGEVCAVGEGGHPLWCVQIIRIEGVRGVVAIILCGGRKLREAEEAEKAGVHDVQSCEYGCEGEEHGYYHNPPHGGRDQEASLLSLIMSDY